jgi:hypothetical protein
MHRATSGALLVVVLVLDLAVATVAPAQPETRCWF